MKKAGLFAFTALSFIVHQQGVVATTAAAAATYSNVDAIPLHPKYRAHLKCPYADKWLTKGPKQAALELGLDEHGRKLQQSSSSMDDVQGSCSYTNAFTGGMTCLQFNGSAWTTDDMTSRCDKEGGTISTEGCTSVTAGWCTKMIGNDKHEYTAMELSAMADCDQSKMACEVWMSGTFVADGECASAPSSAETTSGNIFGGDSTMSGPPPGVVAGEGSGTGGHSDWASMGSSFGDSSATKCLIAPGAIGAAHQAGYSQGYSTSCPNTPAQESPYMWPMKWSADTESHGMAFGSDDVVFHSKAKVYYMLDKNWKRLDFLYQSGTFRGLGSDGPCGNEVGCDRNQTETSTMIHKGGMMYFIDWIKDDVNPVESGEVDIAKIESCREINLAVVGNIRPDWFMDKRGDDTDVQYLGDQHVYHADGQIPKLVKQWRKKDFASQYFTMSMMGNPPNKLAQDPEAPVEDNMHWPLILNIPGEGFGDDQLQVYKNHALLTDDDEVLFQVVENYIASGGVCAGNDEMAEAGPPTDREHIPSNLEVDPMSWVSNEVTFSPIWIPEKTIMSSSSSTESTADAPVSSSGKSILSVSDRLTVESCYDEATQSMDMSIHFHDVELGADGLLPWMAIGYRPTDVCAMTPPDGSSTPLIMLTHSSEGELPVAHKTILPPEAKRFSQEAFTSIYASMEPLGDVQEYDSVSLEAPMLLAEETEDTVSLHFKQKVEGSPEALNLMYAIGGSSQLGIHMNRGCFQVPTKNLCGSNTGSTDDEGNDMVVPNDTKVEEAKASEAAESSLSVKSTVSVSDRLTVESCYDEATQSMDMSIHFHDVEADADGLLPWMAIGYRPTDLCYMTPPDGSSTPLVMLTHWSAGGMPDAHKTMLPPEAKSFSQEAFDSIYLSMEPLGDVQEYDSVSVEAPMLLAEETAVARSVSSFAAEDTVSLHFTQKVEGGRPEVLNLMYAIGRSSELGMHDNRGFGCFQAPTTVCGSDSWSVTNTDTTSEAVTVDLSEGEEKKGEEFQLSEPTEKSSASIGICSTIIFSMTTVAALIIGF